MIVFAVSLALAVSLAAPGEATMREDATLATGVARDAKAVVRVVVQPGDTVWALGRAHLPDGEHLQRYVARIIAVNRIEAGALVPGSVLSLPVE